MIAAMSSRTKPVQLNYDIPSLLIIQRILFFVLLFIPSHKATGDGGISTKIFKIAAPAVLPSLTQ